MSSGQTWDSQLAANVFSQWSNRGLGDQNRKSCPSRLFGMCPSITSEVIASDFEKRDIEKATDRYQLGRTQSSGLLQGLLAIHPEDDGDRLR